MALFVASIQEFLAAAGVKTIPYRPYLPPLFRVFYQPQGSRLYTRPICRLSPQIELLLLFQL
jgi:hypothetical protein